MIKKTTTEQRKKEYEKQIAELFIEGIKNNTAPWMKPWKPGKDLRDFNMVTMQKTEEDNTYYQGMNSLITELTRTIKLKSEDPRWITFLELQKYNEKIKDPKEKIYIKKDEEGTMIRYFSTAYFDKNGKRLDSSSPDFDNSKVETVKKIYKPSFIFNACQLGKYTYDENGKIMKDENNKFIYRPALEPFKSEIINDNVKSVKNADKFIEDIGVSIIHDKGDRCYYSPLEDKIHMVDKNQFNSTSDYYDTLFHEIIHWTGNSKRLDREEAKNYGKSDEAHSKEELIAEIGGFMLCRDLEIEFTPSQNNIAYVQSWIQDLQDKPENIFETCQKAKTATNYLKDLSENKTINNEIEITKLENYDKKRRQGRT